MALDLDGLAIFLQFLSYCMQHGNNKIEGKQSKKEKAKFDLSHHYFSLMYQSVSVLLKTPLLGERK